MLKGVRERLCGGCGVQQPVEDFPFKNAAVGKRHSRCRACLRQNSRRHYQGNKRAYLKRNQKNNPLQRNTNRLFVMQFLLEHPCVRCGQSDPVLLEFNHIDPATKTANVCDVIHSRASLTRVRDEIGKCEVLCANCHQRHTALQSADRYKLVLAQDGQTEIISKRIEADLRNIRILLEHLRQSACVDCGMADPVVLQFDHIESKTNDIASLVRSGCNTQRLVDELKKCDVRCANCHRRRTAYAGGWFRARQRAMAQLTAPAIETLRTWR
jgi:hypothetical protein